MTQTDNWHCSQCMYQPSDEGRTRLRFDIQKIVSQWPWLRNWLDTDASQPSLLCDLCHRQLRMTLSPVYNDWFTWNLNTTIRDHLANPFPSLGRDNSLTFVVAQFLLRIISQFSFDCSVTKERIVAGYAKCLESGARGSFGDAHRLTRLVTEHNHTGAKLLRDFVAAL